MNSTITDESMAEYATKENPEVPESEEFYVNTSDISPTNTSIFNLQAIVGISAIAILAVTVLFLVFLLVALITKKKNEKDTKLTNFSQLLNMNDMSENKAYISHSRGLNRHRKVYSVTPCDHVYDYAYWDIPSSNNISVDANEAYTCSTEMDLERNLAYGTFLHVSVQDEALSSSGSGYKEDKK